MLVYKKNIFPEELADFPPKFELLADGGLNGLDTKNTGTVMTYAISRSVLVPCRRWVL
jgi:hypothetical protein